MKPRLWIFAATAAVAVHLACAPAGPPPEALPSDAEARAIVDTIIQTWDAAMAAGDVDAAMAVYAPDAIRMQPGVPPMVGREAIRVWVQAGADQHNAEGSNETLEVGVLGPGWIFYRGSYSYTLTPKAGGEARTVGGTWLSLVQRQPDGTWKVYRDAGSQRTS